MQYVKQTRLPQRGDSALFGGESRSGRAIVVDDLGDDFSRGGHEGAVRAIVRRRDVQVCWGGSPVAMRDRFIRQRGAFALR